MALTCGQQLDGHVSDGAVGACGDCLCGEHPRQAEVCNLRIIISLSHARLVTTASMLPPACKARDAVC